MSCAARTTRGGLALHPSAPYRGQVWQRHSGERRIIEQSRATFNSYRYSVVYSTTNGDGFYFCYAMDWEEWVVRAALVQDRPKPPQRCVFPNERPGYLPAPLVANENDRHRQACAEALGFTTRMLAAVCDWNYRGDAVLLRERLIVAMRDTPTENGVRPSFPDIADALRAKNHSTIITAYKRAKARAQVPA